MYKHKETNEQIQKHIVDAYFKLLKQYDPKEAEKISVTEITDWAGVSRTAYYRNFHRKSEIVECYFRDSLWKTFLERIKNYSFWSYEYGVEFFTILKENREILLLMDEHGYLDCIMKIFNEKNEELAGDMPYDSMDRFNLYFAAGGSFNVAMIWLRDGCKESPEQLAKSFVRFSKCCNE
jgi:AcrR family transcriptional regulator